MSHKKRVVHVREAPAVTNADVARLFREASDLLELLDENPFRVRAYRTAARTVEELPEAVGDLVAGWEQEQKGGGVRHLAELPGLGADLAGKVIAILRTGSFETLDELRRRVPRGLPDLMRLPGLGPKRARQLHDALGISTLAQLGTAARAKRVRKVPGFGAKTEEQILAALATDAGDERRMLRAAAAQYAEQLVAYLRGVDGVKEVEVAGSYRRAKETVGDLDILVTTQRRSGAAVVRAFAEYPGVERVIAKGSTRGSIKLQSGLQVDLRVLQPESFGAGLYYFTGSKAHNIAVRRIAQDRGLKVNEYGIYRGRRRVAGRTEQEVFATFDLAWIPPELRENRGEIEAAREGKLPTLVTLEDLRGDLQSHTTGSDGRDTLEAMAEAAEALGRNYLAITDHSPSLRMVQGLDRAGYRKQMRQIERLNGRLRRLRVLAGAEVDILEDGSLDLDDETLAALDIVVVAIHSRFGLSEAQQTARVVRALQHASVDVLGHPTGRLIGRREPIRLDLDAVIRTAVDHGVLLEVNAQPERLDLDDVAARRAVELGARLVISTDAHATAELGFLRWGVDQARRGWVEAKDVANARSLERFLDLLHGKR